MAGLKVRVQGYSKYDDEKLLNLNDKQGVVKEFDATTKTWVVEVDNEKMHFLPEKISPCPNQAVVEVVMPDPLPEERLMGVTVESRSDSILLSGTDNEGLFGPFLTAFVGHTIYKMQATLKNPGAIKGVDQWSAHQDGVELSTFQQWLKEKLTPKWKKITFFMVPEDVSPRAVTGRTDLPPPTYDCQQISSPKQI